MPYFSYIYRGLLSVYIVSVNGTETVISNNGCVLPEVRFIKVSGVYEVDVFVRKNPRSDIVERVATIGPTDRVYIQFAQ